MENSNAFDNSLALKALNDYTQFQTTILTSPRGGGKTVLVQKHKLLDKYLKYGYCFVLVRESQIEIDNALSGGFWDSYITDQEIYRNVQFGIKGNCILINGKVAGVAVALTTFCNVRGSVFNFAISEKIKKDRREELENEIQEFEKFSKSPQVHEIFFDEFEPIKAKMSGANRLKAFLHIAETYFRFRHNVHATLCANLENAFSPFLSEFNFPDLRDLSYGLKKSYTRERHPRPLAVWVHMQPNSAWKELRQESYVGKITGNSEMFSTGDAYIGTNYNSTPKETHRTILYNIHADGYKLTFWTDRRGKFFISERTKNKTFKNYTFKLNQCDADTLLLPERYRERLLTAWKNNLIFFDSSKAFDEFIAILPQGRGK